MQLSNVGAYGIVSSVIFENESNKEDKHLILLFR